MASRERSHERKKKPVTHEEDWEQEQMVMGTKLMQQLATASLPQQAMALQKQYGDMASTILAEAVSGRPWGLAKVRRALVGRPRALDLSHCHA